MRQSTAGRCDWASTRRRISQSTEKSCCQKFAKLRHERLGDRDRAFRCVSDSLLTLTTGWARTVDAVTIAMAHQENDKMEDWRKVWRDGVAPLLTLDHLIVLRDALERDDPALIQKATSQPPPLQCVQDWPPEGACAFGYCGWKGDDLKTVGEVEEFFARMCFEVDQRVNEAAGCRWFLNWYDETPRDQMRGLLLPEVKLAIADRSAGRP